MPDPDRLQPPIRAGVTAQDRRGAARLASTQQALISPLDARQTAIVAQIRDVSATGIGLLSARRYERGTALFIQVQDDGSALPAMLVGKVVHVTAQPEGGWLIGCALIRRLTDAYVQGLADGPAAPDRQ